VAEKEFSIIMGPRQVKHALSRIAHEILESAGDDDQLAIIGIRSNGDCLADRLAAEIAQMDGREVEVGYMDITLYRDDLMTNPEHPDIRSTDILFSLEKKLVVLVDDVLFTGRTIRAALNQTPDYGRPRAVRLAVLIDRGGRELPIRADFVGKNLPTSSTDDVVVELEERGVEDRVMLYRGGRQADKSEAIGETKPKKSKAATKKKSASTGRGKK
jgi:pyrimidine operon attenuation protein/uracil phosphoribosyltransferase